MEQKDRSFWVLQHSSAPGPAQRGWAPGTSSHSRRVGWKGGGSATGLPAGDITEVTQGDRAELAPTSELHYL